mmetsp:Transcript_11197/g.25687  ORF Transcript_11197/g.25687 Transcript_11197/m.25687 type:complete len:214 (-) Transcript_11197:617-1258(-)
MMRNLPCQRCEMRLDQWQDFLEFLPTLVHAPQQLLSSVSETGTVSFLGSVLEVDQVSDVLFFLFLHVAIHKAASQNRHRHANDQDTHHHSKHGNYFAGDCDGNLITIANSGKSGHGPVHATGDTLEGRAHVFSLPNIAIQIMAPVTSLSVPNERGKEEGTHGQKAGQQGHGICCIGHRRHDDSHFLRQPHQLEHPHNAREAQDPKELQIDFLH